MSMNIWAKGFLAAFLVFPTGSVQAQQSNPYIPPPQNPGSGGPPPGPPAYLPPAQSQPPSSNPLQPENLPPAQSMPLPSNHPLNDPQLMPPSPPTPR